MIRLRCLSSPVIALGLAAAVWAQVDRPTFDVVSVKRNTSNGGSFSAGPRPGGVYQATNAPVSVFIIFAYDIRDYQLVGGPRWLRTDRFDISARAGRDASTSELRLMVQSLLEERFKLVARRAQRDMAHFAVVLARTDGPLGPGLTRVGDDCAAATAQAATPSAAAAKSDDKPLAVPLLMLPPGSRCGPISGIADLASRVLQAPVVDKTGLTGNWQFVLRFGSAIGESFGMPLAAGASEPGMPSFSTALQDQLGLKLARVEGPVEVLAVESIDQPSED